MSNTIKADFGDGGAQLTPGGAAGTPTLATILRGIADDLTNRSTVAAAISANITETLTASITADALPAFTDPPTALEMAAVRTLVNEIRAVAIELKDLDVEVRALIIQLRAAAVEIKAKMNTALNTVKG